MAEASSSSDALPARHYLLSPYVIVPALHFLSGFSNSLPSTAYRLLQLEDAQLEPQMMTTINGVVGSLPWDFKIFVAFFSDWFPICGRRRIPYLCAALVVQAVAVSDSRPAEPLAPAAVAEIAKSGRGAPRMTHSSAPIHAEVAKPMAPARDACQPVLC